MNKNIAAVDAALEHLHEVKVPGEVTSNFDIKPAVSDKAPEFVKEVLGPMMVLQGDKLPVSKLPDDGTFPSGTSKWEKRNIAVEVPQWNPSACIQCGRCTFICPHATIRAKVYDKSYLNDAPEGWQYAEAKWPQYKEQVFTIQIAPEDCTGCGSCVANCPVSKNEDVSKNALTMVPQIDVRDKEIPKWDYFLSLPEIDKEKLNTQSIKDLMLIQPLFEFCGSLRWMRRSPLS